MELAPMYLFRILMVSSVFCCLIHAAERDSDKAIEQQREMMQNLADSLQAQRKINGELNYVIIVQEYMIIKMANLEELDERQKSIVKTEFPSILKSIKEDRLNVEEDIKRKILFYIQLMKERKLLPVNKK